MLTYEAAGAGDAMERYFAASKQLSLDREQVRVRVRMCMRACVGGWVSGWVGVVRLKSALRALEK